MEVQTSKALPCPSSGSLQIDDSDSDDTEPEWVSDDDEKDLSDSGHSSTESENLNGDCSGSSIPTNSGLAKPSPIDAENSILKGGVQDVIFELSCTNCLKATVPLFMSCTLGHSLCQNCYTSGKLDKCPVVIGTKDDNEICGYGFYEIDDAYRNTPYFKKLHEVVSISCKYATRGCKADTSLLFIDQHASECAFGILERCQFHGQGCTRVFESLEVYVNHLGEEHGVPVGLASHESLLFQYGQAEFQQENNEEKSGSLLVRAEFRIPCMDYKVALITRELHNGKSRLSFVFVKGKRCPEHLRAQIIIYPQDYRTEPMKHLWNDEHFKEDSIKAHLAVVPSLAILETQKKNESDLPYFVDIDHLDLEPLTCVELPKKAVHMAVAIFEVKPHTSFEFDPGSAVMVFRKSRKDAENDLQLLENYLVQAEMELSGMSRQQKSQYENALSKMQGITRNIKILKHKLQNVTIWWRMDEDEQYFL